MPYYRRHLDDREVQVRWMDPRLRSLRVSHIRTYLVGKGWRETPADQPGVVVFEEPTNSGEEPLFQWIPADEQRREYLQAVYELLAAVAELEDRYAGDVLADMLTVGVGSSNGLPKVKTETVQPG